MIHRGARGSAGRGVKPALSAEPRRGGTVCPIRVTGTTRGTNACSPHGLEAAWADRTSTPRRRAMAGFRRFGRDDTPPGTNGGSVATDERAYADGTDADQRTSVMPDN